MSDCTTGDVFDPAESGVGSPGGPASGQGPDTFPHTPVDLSNYRCGAESAVVRLYRSQKARVKLLLRDYNGQPVSIGSSAMNDLTFELRVSHRSGACPFLTIPMTPLSDDPPVVAGDVAAGALKVSGLFPSHVVAIDGDNALVYAMPVWVEGAAPPGTLGVGAPTISEMRLYMRDACPEGNELLNDYEYTDEEIAYCLQRPVDEFNATGVPCTSYVTANFPRQWRAFWVEAAASELMRIASRYYMRNHLEYGGTGVTVNEKNKFQIYEQVAANMHNKWIAFVQQKKAEMNFRRGFGGIGSPYGG